VNRADAEKYLMGCDHALAIDVSAADYAAPQPVRRLYVGVSGDVEVDTVGGEAAVVFKAAPVGFLDVHVTKVYHAGTTATNLVALW
jgi:hypothetical protein